MNSANDRIRLYINESGPYETHRGCVLGEFLDNWVCTLDYIPLIAVMNNELHSLHTKLEADCRIVLLGPGSVYGQKVLRKSAAFLLHKACRDLFPYKKIVVRSTIANGLYLEFINDVIDAESIDQISMRMEELIKADLPIHRHMMPKAEAETLFSEQNQPDTLGIIQMRDKALVHIYELDGFYEYIYDFMVYRTGMIGEFKLTSVAPGLILQVPEPDLEGKVELRPYHCQPKLFNSYRESKHWAELMRTPHVTALNRIIVDKKINELILINEALHEKKIAYIADRICTESERRVILIAGPSASGKTSFAQRLLIQLRANGKHPQAISLDNYFVDRVETPRDARGEYDFESINALKLGIFNDHLQALMRGETVETPVYNFKAGCCESYGLKINVPPGEPIILEGIHCLNDELTVSIGNDQKYRIYVSALTHLNLDYQNHISTTDLRLLRRIVRDARSRGYDAGRTILQWPSVRLGEEKYIFRFQENADVIFNSSLVYELPVLKAFADPMLVQINSRDPAYIESSRLLKLLSYIHPVHSDFVPRNSILAEFIGGSCFNV